MKDKYVQLGECAIINTAEFAAFTVAAKKDAAHKVYYEIHGTLAKRGAPEVRLATYISYEDAQEQIKHIWKVLT